jgi:hypothetical protein
VFCSMFFLSFLVFDACLHSLTPHDTSLIIHHPPPSINHQTTILTYLLLPYRYSMWLPQIAYNAYNGTRRALAPTYLYTTTASRLFIPLYFYGCPDNFMQYVFCSISLPPHAFSLSLALYSSSHACMTRHESNHHPPSLPPSLSSPTHCIAYLSSA